MAVMSALVYYVIPGLLGRAYDLKNDTIGPDLFKHTDTEHAKVIERYMTTSEYRVVSELSEATDFLDVSGKLALKLKTGAIHIEGTGNYLKESKSFQHRVDVLVKVHYETVIKTLPTTILPMENWQDRIKGTGMTHYIRSIKYGGDLVASVRFTTSNSFDKEIIKAEVQGELNAKSGSFGLGLKGSLEKIKEKIGDSAFMDINYYATVPLVNIPRTIQGVFDLVDQFPEQTKLVDEGRGVPLSMEVFSLTGLNKDLPSYYQTMALADQMVIIDEQLSDIRSAEQRLADWLKTVPPVLPEEQNQEVKIKNTLYGVLAKLASKITSQNECLDMPLYCAQLKSHVANPPWVTIFLNYHHLPTIIIANAMAPRSIGKFNTKLEGLDRIFCKVIADLNLSNKANASQFKPAFEAYQGNRTEAIPNMYVKDLSKLKKKVLDGTPSFETDFGGAHYTYWGSNTCPQSAKILFEGVLSSTDHSSIGSSEFTCLPKDRQYLPNEKTESEEQDIEDLPQVQPVVFITRKKGGDQNKRNLIKCANCRVPGKTSTTMLTGTTDCPANWVSQYKGILISTDYKQARGEIVCLDVSKGFTEVPKNLVDLTEVTEVSPKCGSYPCDSQVKDDIAIPCVVCSITKKATKTSDFLRF